MRDDFAAFILTHGRPDNVMTYARLRHQGYTGRIVLIVDDMDATVDQYRDRYGDEVVVFDKRAVAATFDTADNQDDLRTIVFARNACYQVARDLGIRYFVQLDDDYQTFNFRFNDRFEWTTRDIWSRDLDRVFTAFIDFLISTPASTIAMAQGGDFIGGQASLYGRTIRLLRKAMNSFFCDVDRPIGFIGRINEDVNTYTSRATTGTLMFTHNQIALNQVQTQQGGGGMTDVYQAAGTYVKSFYTVMFHPSGAHVTMLNSRSNPRLHHSVDWMKTTPMILSEATRKPR